MEADEIIWPDNENPGDRQKKENVTTTMAANRATVP
jgi:hypothetical protein